MRLRKTRLRAFELAHRLAHVCVALVLCAPAVGTAGGGGGLGSIVYDPTNHAENAVTAAEAVRQTANQLRAYSLQLRQYLAELENLKRLPASTIEGTLKPYAEELAAVERLQTELTTAYGGLKSLQSEFQSRIRQMALLGLQPKDYLEHEMVLAQRQGLGFGAAFKGSVDALRSANGSFQRIKTLQSQISGSAGLQQSMQTMNQHLNLLAGQNAQLVALIASHEANMAAKLGIEADAGAAGAEYQKRRLEADAQAVKRIREELKQIEKATGWGIMSDH